MTIYDGTDVSGVIRPWDLLPGGLADLHGSTVVVMTSHANDAATFTGSTILRLASAGARVVLIAATAAGEDELAELVQVADLLGVARLVPLEMSAAVADEVSIETAARLVAGICLSECAEALVHYDANGIDGDHARVIGHRIGVRAAEISRVTSYEATVDEHYLAEIDPDFGEAPGEVTAITTSVAADVITITAKRQTMLAHTGTSSAHSLDNPRFADIHGLEWYARRGSPSVLDRLDATA